MSKVTLKQVAALAAVGTATVERVLNGRGGVRPALVEKVLAAVHKLDYPKRLPEQHRGVTRIEILMVRRDLSFLARLSKSFVRIAASLDPSISVHRTFLDEADPKAMADYIRSPGLRRSALIVVLPHHPLITEALEDVARKGTHVVQVVSRLEGLSAPYVGIDNVAAGRMAGLLMCGMQRRSGTVIAMCHSQIYGVHRDRIGGFSAFMQKPAASHFEFRQVAFTNDSAREAANIVSSLLRSNENLVGIYGAGGDYDVLCDLISRSRRKDEICLIGHELTEQTAAALKDGTMSAVIDQAPETQARRSLDVAIHALGMMDVPVDHTPIRFITITSENL